MLDAHNTFVQLRPKNKYIDAADAMLQWIIDEIKRITTNFEAVHQQSHDSLHDLRLELFPSNNISELKQFDYSSIEQDCIAKLSHGIVTRENQRNSSQLITPPQPMERPGIGCLELEICELV